MARQGRVAALTLEAVAAGRAGRVQALSIEATGATAQIVAIPAASVKPLATVTTTITLVGGGTADTYSFEQNSGPAVTFSGTGATRTWKAPATVAGTVVQLELTAVKDGITSPPVIVDYTIPPCQLWWHNGGTEKAIRHQ